MQSRVRVDPRSYRIDRLFFARLWKLCRPYWLRGGGRRSWVALATLLLLGVGISLFGGYLSNLSADRTNAMVEKNEPLFWQLFILLASIGFGIFVVGQVQSFIGTWLNLDWRRWLTTHLIDEYLQHRTYYEITVDKDIDNPDQRIQEQVMPFCQTMSNLPQKLFTTSATMGVQAVILAGISPQMLMATVVYAAVSMVVTLWLYGPTIRQNWNATVAEADLRYGLLHVRDNAETVAFYRGESAERQHLVQRLSSAIKAQLRILVYQLKLNGVSEISNVVWSALPMLLIVPLYFKGDISYGTIDQGIFAASILLMGLSTFTQFIPELSAAVPMVVRLAEIQEKFELLGHSRGSEAGVPRIDLRFSDTVTLDNVSVQTPGGEQQLVQGLTLNVRPGEHLVIIGQTGVGKSSLLRVLAGLWSRGEGRIGMPAPSQLLFLPQRPYMRLGTLRDQLLYPHAMSRGLTDADLQAVLERVNLHSLAEKHGGLNAENDWTRVLSLGEQQRLGFARVLISSPRYVFLDEATSAVDLDTEALLYRMIARLPDTTFISIGHRPSLFAYHVNALQLRADGWQLLPVSEIDSATSPAHTA